MAIRVSAILEEGGMMAAIFKRFRGGGVSYSWYFLMLAAVSIIFFGVLVLSAASGMSAGAATLIVSTPVVLTLALIWSVCEIKRLNR
jgi:drug/metabolite transporter (DMT)-like permease